MSPTSNMRVLIGCVHDDRNEACLGFTVGIVNLQAKLLAMPDMDAVISFSTSKDELLNQFHNDATFEVLVVLDAMLGVNPDLVTSNLPKLSELHFITAVYPLPGVDWSMIQAKAQKDTIEELRFQGLRYNVRLERPIQSVDGGDKILTQQATLRTFIIDRTVIKTVAALAPEYHYGGKSQHLFWTDEVVDGKHKDPSDHFMSRWGQAVWADVEHPITGFGLLSFAGCVGYRSKIR